MGIPSTQPVYQEGLGGRREAMRFKGVLECNMENGSLGAERRGGGVHSGCPGLPVGTASEAVGCVSSSPFRLEGRDGGGEITKNKKPRVKEQ